jgi:hypothetical protein
VHFLPMHLVVKAVVVWAMVNLLAIFWMLWTGRRLDCSARSARRIWGLLEGVWGSVANSFAFF